MARLKIWKASLVGSVTLLAMVGGNFAVLATMDGHQSDTTRATDDLGAGSSSLGPSASGLFPTNSSGLTYGSFITYDGSSDSVPDLIAVVADNGKSGYVPRGVFEAPHVESPADAAAWGATHAEPMRVQVFDVNGQVVVGMFTISASSAGSGPIATSLELRAE